MCDQCEHLDEKIMRYRFMARWISDGQAQKALAEMIEQSEAKKRALHPERGQ